MTINNEYQDKNDPVETAWQEAELAAKHGDHQRVIAALRRLDGLGVRPASARIGEFFEVGGIGVAKNIEEAARWYRKAVADHDDPIAHLGLGRIYYEGGDGIKQEFQLARTHLEKAFAGGVEQAGIYLGLMSMYGIDGERNLDNAERYFLAAAGKGFPIAYRYLANIFALTNRPFGTTAMLLREFFLTSWLRMKDHNHPNIWKLKR